MILPPSNSNSKQNGPAVLPPGFMHLKGRLLVENTQGGMDEVCDHPLRVVALSRAADESGLSGVVFGWGEGDEYQEYTIDAKKVFHGLNAVLADLADKGLNVNHNKVGEFRRLIQKSSSLTGLPRRLLQTRTGFVKGKLVFVNGDQVIVGQADQDPNVEYVPRLPNGRAANGLTAKGTLDEYSSNVLEGAKVNLLRYSICAALAAPLADLLGLEGGGSHLAGPSGCGKSTALQAAASVFGIGADPGDGSQDSFILRWNGTSNSWEVVLAERSGLGVFVDELGAHNGSKFSPLLYKVLSGKGNNRMTSDLALAKQFSASVSMLSTGELGIEEKLRLAREPVNAGIHARMPTIYVNADDMALEGECNADTALRIEGFKEACGKYGGVLGPEFVRNLLDGYDSREELENSIREEWDAITEQLAGYAQNSIQRRGLRRFALTMMAGFLAQEMGLLPWTEEEISEAVTFVIERWLENLESSKTDAERAVDRLKDWIRRYYHAIPDSWSSDIKGPIDGYKHNDYLLLLPDTFRRLCQDVLPSQVANQLKAAGALRHDEGKQKYRVTIPCTDKRQYFYAIRNEFVEDILASDRPSFDNDEGQEPTGDDIDELLAPDESGVETTELD